MAEWLSQCTKGKNRYRLQGTGFKLQVAGCKLQGGHRYDFPCNLKHVT